ncbi:unnamed protein product [Amoebophrya sp. A25]|nr:unnamed protein product [Amoebophrya sp. A25]|eukprot:GSA25T00010937001.1
MPAGCSSLDEEESNAKQALDRPFMDRKRRRKTTTRGCGSDASSTSGSWRHGHAHGRPMQVRRSRMRVEDVQRFDTSDNGGRTCTGVRAVPSMATQFLRIFCRGKNDCSRLVCIMGQQCQEQSLRPRTSVLSLKRTCYAAASAIRRTLSALRFYALLVYGLMLRALCAVLGRCRVEIGLKALVEDNNSCGPPRTLRRGIERIPLPLGANATSDCEECKTSRRVPSTNERSKCGSSSRRERSIKFHDHGDRGDKVRGKREKRGHGLRRGFQLAARLLLHKLIPVFADVGRQFYDPDCVREDPFWSKYLELVSAQVAAGEKPDFHVSRYALQIAGCPLGKLVACVGSENMSLRECFYHIPVDFYLLMSSRWPILKLLDAEQQKIWDSGVLEENNGDDCILSAHPAIEWNQFRGALAEGVGEAHRWLVEDNKKEPRANLGWAISFADGVIFKSHSDAVLDSGLSVAEAVGHCQFGVVSAHALRMFAILLADGDVYRMLERGFQQVETIWNRKHQILYSRWRLFGIVHILNELKKQKLDLPEAALTDDLDQAPKYLQSRNPWDWRVGDLTEAIERQERIKLLKKPMPMEHVSRADYQNEGSEAGGVKRDEDVMPLPNSSSAAAVEGRSSSSSASGASEVAHENGNSETDEESFYEDTEAAIAIDALKHPSNLPEDLEKKPFTSIESMSEIVQQNTHTKKEDNNEIYWRLSRIVRNNRILFTSVDTHTIRWLKNWLRRSKYFMKQSGIGIVLQNVHLDLQCKSVASGQLSKLDHSLEKHMCLPKLSESSVFLSVLGYMRIGALAGYDVGYVGISNFWVRNPFPYLWVKDINVATEFYGSHKTRLELFTVKGTARGLLFLTDLLSLVYFFPFTFLPRAMDRLSFGPHITDRVPTVSFAEDNFLHYHLFFVHFFDCENRFVSTDGWFGKPDQVVFFDIQKLIADHERQRIFDLLYSGTIGGGNHPIRVARSSVSAKRRTWLAYDGAPSLPGNISTASVVPQPAEWTTHPGSSLAGGCVQLQDYTFVDVNHAKNLCIQLGPDVCGGISCTNEKLGECFIRDATPLVISAEKDEAEAELLVLDNGAIRVRADGNADKSDRAVWAQTLLPAETPNQVSLVPPGFQLPTREKIIHVNFASGCCEEDQRESSESAVRIGKVDISYAMGDADLSQEFKEKNKELLEFLRTPEMTRYKTPSGKVGYYVWKPYIVLKTLLEKAEPGDLVVWTDAGITFTQDVRPLLARYLRGSDMSATQTPMMEGDFTKRDAFQILGLDVTTVAESQQIATGVILARKTPLAIKFLEDWLEACEDRRVMTEEGNVLGFPNFPSFKNHNDDQSAFSLLFKKYGFTPFPQSTRDAYVLTGRNLAKYLHAAERFALGQTSTQDSYLAAANMRDDNELLKRRGDLREITRDMDLSQASMKGNGKNSNISGIRA